MAAMGRHEAQARANLPEILGPDDEGMTRRQNWLGEWVLDYEDPWHNATGIFGRE